MKVKLNIFLLALLALLSCNGGSKVPVPEAEEEDKKAEALLQGIWLNAENDEVTMKVKGDSIFYADSTLIPVRFAIINDSLVLRTHNESRYAIVKQTANLFYFNNSAGDVVKLVKSNNDDDNWQFDANKRVVNVNQNQLIKRDSIVTGADKRYRVYTQVNPTQYKVVNVSYNDDGLQVETVYYDNIVNICIYDGGRRLYSSDFHKQDFNKFVPADFMSQAILSDIVLDSVSSRGVELLAYIVDPDSVTQYVVRLVVSHGGVLKMES